MKYSRTSRRMFLRGAGGAALGIPLLSSLLPREARSDADDPPVRYLQWVTDHGQYEQNFWPADAFRPTATATFAGQTFDGIRTRDLASIPGDMSLVLGPELDAIRPKINLLRGLGLIVDAHLHNACAPTCASYPREDNHVPFFSHSVDSVLETSASVYPLAVKSPALRMTPGVSSAYKWGSFSWTTQNGEPFKLPAHETTVAAADAVFGNGGEMPMEDPKIARRMRLVDRVIGDYRSVRDSSRIGAADKAQLGNYMDLLADVQRQIGLELPVGCERPSPVDEVDFDALHRSAAGIAVAAMLCRATRVVAYHCYQGSPVDYDEETFHAWAHDDANLHGGLMKWRYRQLASLIATMDSFVDTDGKTLLDNSFVYAGNELSHPGHGDGHLQNMPVITAGGAGGRLVTGQYVDFGGRLLNNLLVTVFHTMGVPPEEYEREGVVGFGDYDGPNAGDYAAYLSDTERRAALPFLYRG